MISKQKNPVEKPKKSVEKPKKPVEKPKKPVEKPKKSVEKPKKSVEKPKKSVPKKRVKNVNVDKIINIIKKYIIKCGIKNPKLKREGGSKIADFFVKGVKNITNAAQRLTTKKIGNIDKNECFENLKAIDDVFKSIHEDVVDARKKLLKFLKEKQSVTTNKVLFDKLLSKYIFMVSDNELSSFHNYKYNTDIHVDFKIEDIDKITIENYLIVYIIDIVAQLERYRKGMLLCAQKDEDEDEDDKKLFEHTKDKDADDFYYTVPAITAAHMSLSPIAGLLEERDDTYEEMDDI